jgi:hypothetical protein
MIMSVAFHEDGTASVTCVSMISGKTTTRTLKMTAQQYHEWFFNGVLIQDAMPHLSRSESEFLMTGTTEEEWKATFGDE